MVDLKVGDDANCDNGRSKVDWSEDTAGNNGNSNLDGGISDDDDDDDDDDDGDTDNDNTVVIIVMGKVMLVLIDIEIMVMMMDVWIL